MLWESAHSVSNLSNVKSWECHLVLVLLCLDSMIVYAKRPQYLWLKINDLTRHDYTMASLVKQGKW